MVVNMIKVAMFLFIFFQLIYHIQTSISFLSFSKYSSKFDSMCDFNPSKIEMIDMIQVVTCHKDTLDVSRKDLWED